MREIDEALIAVKEERIYQENKWKDVDTCVAKFLILIHNYTHQAMERQSGIDCLSDDHGVLDDLRKIAALAICAMEYNGVAYRRDGGHDEGKTKDADGSVGTDHSP